MPIGTAFVAHVGRLREPLVLLLILGCWFGSALVFFYPYALLIDRLEVKGTWVGGKRKAWARGALELGPPSSFLNWAFGARPVRVGGKTVFVIWKLMAHADEALEALEARPSEPESELSSE